MRLFKSGVVAATTATVVALAGTSLGQPRPMQKDPVTPQQEPAMPQQQPTPQQDPAMPQQQPQTDPAAECPEFLRGVDLSIQDVKRGVAFKFTTPRKENVKELRQLLTDAADVIEEHSKMTD